MRHIASGVYPVTRFNAAWVILTLLALSAVSMVSAESTVRAQSGTPTSTLLAESTFAVYGQVNTGTAGATLPSGLIVTLNIVRFNPDNPSALPDVRTLTQPLSSINDFSFEQVTARTGDNVFVTVPHGGVLQGSIAAAVTDTHPDLALPFLIYEPTTNINVITLVNAEYTLDFAVGNVMQVLAKFYYRNTSDRMFISGATDKSNRPVSVVVPLPVGARAIAFNAQVSSRFNVVGDDIFPIVQDTKPVMPGESHEVIFSYQVPYQNAAPIDQDYPYQTAQVAVLIPQDVRVRLTGDFSSAVSSDTDGKRQYVQYTTNKPLKAGERLLYTVEGVPPVQQSKAAVARDSSGLDFTPLLVLGGAAIGLMAVVLGLLSRRGKPSA